MILSALFVKFLSAGAVAQAATGATVAVVAFTGVGAAGALPDPVQDTFATVVAELTPLQPPTSEETTGETTEEVVAEETLVEESETTDEATEVVDDAAATEAYVTAWALDGPAGSESFAAWVREGNEDARVKEWLRANGMNFGNVVSAWASGKGLSEAELAILGAKAEEPIEAPAEQKSDEESTTVSTTQGDQAETAVADSGARGNGNGKGNNGNASGRGNGKN